MLEKQRHIFPRRLSRDYHDIPKPREKLSSFHKEKRFQVENPENIYRVTYQKDLARRLDEQVIKERKEMIQNSAKISRGTPDWWKSTFNYFKRSEGAGSKMPTVSLNGTMKNEKIYDIFNRKRNSFHTIQELRREKNERNERQKPPTPLLETKIHEKRTLPLYMSHQNEITPKVGSLDTRNYSIKKPLLKIGRDSFVDTYHVF